MKVSVIIISKNRDDSLTQEYEKYFDEVFFVNSINTLSELFSKIDSDYIMITLENEFYAEDGYMLTTYLKSHNLDFVVGNRVNNNQYQKLSNIYKLCNRRASHKWSKLTKHYIPDLFSTCYILSKKFYKKLNITNNFQLDCITHSDNFAYIDIRFVNQSYSKLFSIKKYISARLYRKEN
ncbi:MAG: hypothetical protein IJZ79_01495 [Bacilli bacterium]|nr:hypothetical protein [Bacilli bacterium]